MRRERPSLQRDGLSNSGWRSRLTAGWLEAVGPPQLFGTAVGVVDGAVDEICPPPVVRADRGKVVGSRLTWWARSPLVGIVPAVQRGLGLPPHRESANGIEQVGVRRGGNNVFGPELESQVACEAAGTVAEPGRVGWRPVVEAGIDDRTRDLRIMGPGTTVESVRADRDPDVVDDAHLGMTV